MTIHKIMNAVTLDVDMFIIILPDLIGFKVGFNITG